MAPFSFTFLELDTIGITMSKRTQLEKDKVKAERKFREKIEEKRKERELFLSNRANQRMVNKLTGATYRRPIE
jgi:hypothetical protein